LSVKAGAVVKRVLLRRRAFWFAPPFGLGEVEEEELAGSGGGDGEVGLVGEGEAVAGFEGIALDF